MCGEFVNSPVEKFTCYMKMNCDARGSSTELVYTADCGQVSINISKPGITKGQHWDNRKWEQKLLIIRLFYKMTIWNSG